MATTSRVARRRSADCQSASVRQGNGRLSSDGPDRRVQGARSTIMGRLKEKVGELNVVPLSPEKQTGIVSARGGKPASEKAVLASAREPASPPSGSRQHAGKAPRRRHVPHRRQADRLQRRRQILGADRPQEAVVGTDRPAHRCHRIEPTTRWPPRATRSRIKGVMMPTRSGPMVQATEVKIELAEPLAGGEEEGVGRSQAPGEARQEGRRSARTGRRQVT